MADQATANFKAAWRDRDQREAATLIKVELTRPSARTLYLSAREEIATPGAPAQVWEGGLVVDAEPIIRQVSLRESSWAPASSSFTLVNGSFTYQADGETVLDAFAEYGWIGAAVTIYLWEKSLTSFSDALAYQGFVVQDVELERFVVTVRIIQRYGWNREADLKQVTRKKYPRAPEESVGLFIPKVRGSVKSVGLRPPWTSAYDVNQHGWEHITGGRRAVPGIIVDAGGGGTTPGTPTKVLFTSHACKTFFDPAGGYANGALPYLSTSDRLSLFDAATADTFNASDGAGIEIADDASGIEPYEVAFFPVMPVNVELYAANNAENPRAALDVLNETSYARLIYDAPNAARQMKVRLPTLSPAGDIVAVYYALGYRTYNAGGGTILVMQAYNTVGAATIVSLNLAAAANPTFNSVVDSAPANSWTFGDVIIEVYFNGAQAGVSADIFFLGAIVKFRPNREVIGKTTYRYDPVEPGEGNRRRGRGDRPIGRHVVERSTVTIFDEVKWFATLEGYADSGGTYTGSGTDLIQRAPDIAHHVLVVEGNESSSDLTTAGSTFGSFVDARAALKTWRQSDMVHALVLTSTERVSSALERLGSDAGVWFYLSEFDDKWKAVVWQAGAAVDGLELIEKLSLAQPPRLRPTPGSRRETGVRVLYGHDYHQNKPIHECSIGPGRSQASHKYLNLRDQQFTVVSSGDEQNDKIDFTGPLTATIAAGEYDSAGMLDAVKDALVAASGAYEWAPCHGTTIVSGINDKFSIQENEGAQDVITVTLTAGEYATFELLCAELQTRLNASSDSFTVTYSRTTRLVTIARAGNTFRLGAAVASNANRVGLPVFGFTPLATTSYASSHSGVDVVEEELFRIGATNAAIDLYWQTGTNGTDGNNVNAANLLGYDAAHDRLDNTAPSTLGSIRADCPTSTREQLIVDTVAVTDSERPPAILDGQTIYDHDTAREVRDRFADLMLVDRPEAEFVLVDMPWVESGRVYECAASVDDLIPYAVEGSDGSWAGKKFQVLSKAQHIMGSYVTEITTAEVS